MQNDEILNQCHRSIQMLKKFINENWSDPIAKEYLLWIDQVELKTKNIRIKRENLLNKEREIWQICENIIQSPDDSSKTLTKTKKRK